jgi:hypothetical protein
LEFCGQSFLRPALLFAPFSHLRADQIHWRLCHRRQR